MLTLSLTLTSTLTLALTLTFDDDIDVDPSTTPRADGDDHEEHDTTPLSKRDPESGKRFPAVLSHAATGKKNRLGFGDETSILLRYECCLFSFRSSSLEFESQRKFYPMSNYFFCAGEDIWLTIL